MIVVVDGPEAPASLPGPWDAEDRLELLAWPDIDASLSDPRVISRGDSAIRSFGFWRAWTLGAEVIFTLDDDCHPVAGMPPAAFAEAHLHNLDATPRWASTVAGLRVRGLPYRNLGTLSGVGLSLGLWTGHPDLDAVQTLAGPPATADVASTVTTVLPSSQYFPLSGMNMAFRAGLACLMYFAPMGMEQPYRRFDDIWCGLVLQRICRHLDVPIVCGQPVVHHLRASDPFINLAKEAPGIGANEHLWEVIDGIDLVGAAPLECMREVGRALADGTDGYVRRWGRAIDTWCDLFEPGS